MATALTTVQDGERASMVLVPAPWLPAPSTRSKWVEK